ncbi:hypothetical protein BOTNAR_0055g00200 [Botryotinia narcissicola]|uniref:Cytochrome P450 n=1 Tax=Botryotinia narcissicola TaxID=278944 RepID=A0A4Z1JC15_9HELO|nr:hypothetical protein BOTNAR_0055g00200 [Botryotinia narcissicola]
MSFPVTDTEAKAIPYLQAVIKEGLRKFPVIAGLLPRTVPGGGDIINGFSIPAGTEVSLSLISIAHSKATSGPDAHIFRPERWFECDDTDKLRKMTLAADLVFGSDSTYPWRIRPSRGSRSVLGHIYNPVFLFDSRREHINSDAGYFPSTSRSKNST